MPTFRMFNNAGDRCVNNPPSGTYFRQGRDLIKKTTIILDFLQVI